MQQGIQVLRRLRREYEQEQRRRFSSIRMLSMRSLQDPVPQLILAAGSPPVCNEAEFSFTPIDLANLEPKRHK
jgi:hypothetical protein